MCAAGCAAGRAAGRAAGCVVHAPKIPAPSGLRCVVDRVATSVAGRAVRCAANRGVRRPKNSRAVGRWRALAGCAAPKKLPRRRRRARM